MSDIDHAAQLARRRLDQYRCALRINLTHSTEVMGKVTFENELGQDRLLNRWRMPVRQASRRCESVHDPIREHHETKAQRVEEHLAEGADINHRTGLVQAL